MKANKNRHCHHAAESGGRNGASPTESCLRDSPPQSSSGDSSGIQGNEIFQRGLAQFSKKRGIPKRNRIIRKHERRHDDRGLHSDRDQAWFEDFDERQSFFLGTPPHLAPVGQPYRAFSHLAPNPKN